MERESGEGSRSKVSLWSTSWLWLGGLWKQWKSRFGKSSHLLPSRFKKKERTVGHIDVSLVTKTSSDIQDLLSSQAPFHGAVCSIVNDAMRDYLHLSKIVLGPGASVDVADDVERLGLAEQCLREIILKASSVQVLSDVASDNVPDRLARRSAGEALLKLGDQEKVLKNLSNAALVWAASGLEADAVELQKCFDTLQR